MTKTTLAGAALAALTLVAGHAEAAVQSKCLAAKIACAAKEANALLACHQKAETPRKPADPNFNGCLDKARAAFDGGARPEKGCFEKLESKAKNDCVSFDDTAAMDALVDRCVADVVAAIDPGPIDQTKCGAAKKKCVAKKIGAVLKCHKQAATPNKPIDPNFNGCIDEAKAKFDGGADPAKGCFVKEETKRSNDCQAPLGNQALLEAIVDDCVDAIVAAVQPPTSTTSTSTTTPATTSTTTTTLPAGVACGANGLQATIAIQYSEPLLGGISAIKLRAHYADPPVRIPGTANELSVRQRVTSLLPAGYTLQVTPAPFGDHDGPDADAVEDTLEVRALASTPNSIRPGDVFRVRFDCPAGAGTLVAPGALGCSHLEAGGLDGNPLPTELAALITCTVSLATAP